MNDGIVYKLIYNWGNTCCCRRSYNQDPVETKILLEDGIKFRGTSYSTYPDYFDFSNITDWSNMFTDNNNLLYAPSTMSNAVLSGSIINLFANCTSLLETPELDTSQCTRLDNIFSGCSSLTEVTVQYDLSNCTRAVYMFYNCTSLVTIPALNAQNITLTTYMFTGCSALQNFGGLIDIGTSYTLSDSPLLTVESLMNCIDGLRPVTSVQRLTIGATNRAKLTNEQIAIANNKNWIIS